MKFSERNKKKVASSSKKAHQIKVTKVTPSADAPHQKQFSRLRTCSQIKQTMKIIFFLIGVSLLVAFGFLISFFWAVNDGQFEDDYTPSVRILLEDKIDEME